MIPSLCIVIQSLLILASGFRYGEGSCRGNLTLPILEIYKYKHIYLKKYGDSFEIRY